MLASILCFAGHPCNGQKVDNSTVQTLDLDRYLGPWYEIARFDHSFERGLTHAKAEYTLNDNGTITVTNSGLKKGKTGLPWERPRPRIRSGSSAFLSSVPSTPTTE